MTGMSCYFTSDMPVVPNLRLLPHFGLLFSLGEGGRDQFGSEIKIFCQVKDIQEHEGTLDQSS